MFGIYNAIALVFSLACVHCVSGMTLVEGFDGGSVLLPCTLKPNGGLTWKQSVNLILFKPVSGVLIIPEGLYKGDVSLVHGADLRISPLRRNRDGTGGGGDKVFVCEYLDGGNQQTQLRLLARITEVVILETIGGRVIVTTGTPKTLTCSVTGDPNPLPSYSWSVDDVIKSGQTSNSYTFTPDKSMKTVKCTVTNIYSDGSVLSVKEASATLNLQYLDPPIIPSPVIVLENEDATLRCIAKGNPPPSYEWRKSGSSDVRSTSLEYIKENVQRSDAGEYTCQVDNPIKNYQRTVDLIVEYPPNVTVTFDKDSSTLTCITVGGTGNFVIDVWEHRLDEQLLSVPSSKSSTLKLPDTLTYEDTGYYVCQVSNGRAISPRGQVLVTPQTPAIFQRQSGILSVHLGMTENIALPFYTYSDTPNLKVKWKKSGESTELTSHREEPGLVRLMIHGQIVSIGGTVTVLTLREVTQADEGNYTVTVTNDINRLPRSSKQSFVVKVLHDDDSQIVGLTVGVAVLGVVVLLFIVVFIVIWLRKSRGKSGAMAQRPTPETIATNTEHNTTEDTSYEKISVAPDYQNSTPAPVYDTMAQ